MTNCSALDKKNLHVRIVVPQPEQALTKRLHLCRADSAGPANAAEGGGITTEHEGKSPRKLRRLPSPKGRLPCRAFVRNAPTLVLVCQHGGLQVAAGQSIVGNTRSKINERSRRSILPIHRRWPGYEVCRIETRAAAKPCRTRETTGPALPGRSCGRRQWRRRRWGVNALQPRLAVSICKWDMRRAAWLEESAVARIAIEPAR